MNNKERFELEALPERIEALEAEQEQLYAQMHWLGQSCFSI
jgi:BMFP domain-containing protein YqiC